MVRHEPRVSPAGGHAASAITPIREIDQQRKIIKTGKPDQYPVAELESARLERQLEHAQRQSLSRSC